MRAARERIAGLTGRAEAAAGRVRVTWAAGTGLDELRIDPRAMRLSSNELAAAIAEAIGEATADLRRQVNDVMNDEIGPAADRGTARVEEMQEAFNQRMAAITDQLEAARRRLERATRP